VNDILLVVVRSLQPENGVALISCIQVLVAAQFQQVTVVRGERWPCRLYFKHRFRKSRTGAMASGPLNPCPAPFIGTKVVSTPAFFNAV